MYLTGGEVVVISLKESKVEQIFGLVGNQNSPIFVYCETYNIKIIGVRHEQAAIHMADGWTQVTRNIGVAIIVGGPGFTNSITGIVKAYMANTPILVIMGSSVPQQNDCGGLQDMDQLSIIKSYTKWCATIYEAKRIPEYISKAIRVALSEKGPVVLEIPLNILKTQLIKEEINFSMNSISIEKPLACQNKIKKIFEYINNSQRPILLIGDELYYSYIKNELQELIENIKLPVFSLNKARGLLSDQHELSFGNGRMLESGPQIEAFQNADLLLTIGLRYDYQIGFLKEPFFKDNLSVICINEKPYIINFENHRIDLLVIGDSSQILKQLNREFKETKLTQKFNNWINELKNYKQNFWKDLYNNISKYSTSIHPLHLINEIKKIIQDDSIIILDGSNAMFWGGLMFECNYPGQLIIGPDGLLAPMGCGIPLAISAKLAKQNKIVILYTGDGSFGFNVMEFDTAIRYNASIIVIVHNDKSWGFCESTQEALYGKNAATKLGDCRYDKIVKAMGGYGELVEDIRQIPNALHNALASGLPSCINVIVDSQAYAPGAIMFNKALKKMK